MPKQYNKSKEETMKINPNYSVQTVCDENLIVRQGTLGQDMTQLIALNSTSLELWNQFKGKEFTMEEVAQYLADTYKIAPEQAKADAQKWADALIETKVIEL